MHSFAPLLALTGALIQASNAVPTPTQDHAAELEERGLVSDLVGDLDNLAASATGTAAYTSALSLLTSATPTATPTAASQCISALSSVFEASPTPSNIYAAVAKMASAGLMADDPGTLLGFVQGAASGENSMTNNNPKNPTPAVYPNANPSDAPYDLTEAQLREVIYIPSTFQYGASGAPQPIILVPGTGDTGYTTFAGNYIPLLTGSSIGDPVWLNIPGYLLNDAQTNAEYVAYAINYISGISNHRNVSVIGWSQGNIDAQWAFKYWPSTNNKTSDHVAFSPDYHGTVLANALVLGVPIEPPSILQQEYNSNFITTLRSNGGDSAYVPTTTVYSGLYDEIVEPQQGTGASAFLNDARNVGVSNNEVQLVCPGTPAGSFYTHEGTLYNALGYALAVDALTHPGPGQTSRLTLGTVCANYLSPGLSVQDFLITENTIPIALLAILEYPNKVLVEPPIKSYAATS